MLTMISSKNYHCATCESYIIQSIQEQANLHIQVRNCCVIALTNLTLQVKKIGEKKKRASVCVGWNEGELVGSFVRIFELKDFTCKACFSSVHSLINVTDEKVNRHRGS